MRCHCAPELSQPRENAAPSVLCQECVPSWGQRSFLGENNLTIAPEAVSLLAFWGKALGEATEGRLRSDSTGGIAGVTGRKPLALPTLARPWDLLGRWSLILDMPTSSKVRQGFEGGDPKPSSARPLTHQASCPLVSCRHWLGSLCTQG